MNDTGMEAAIGVLDSHWISPSWAPDSIQFDQAFANKEFSDFLSLHGINPRPIPARRHNKNLIESVVISSLHLSLYSAKVLSPSVVERRDSR